MKNSTQALIDRLRETARQVVPKGGKVWLYGSRARETAHDDSDWDLLILLRKSRITPKDEDDIAYPFVVEGWKNNMAVVLKCIHSMNGKLVHSLRFIRMSNAISKAYYD